MPPRFTIVIPTRNRSGLVRYALGSALEQDFPDFEVIVSDNDSSDDTPEVVRQVGGDRIRYVRTPETLPMPDHFEWALRHASGEYIMYLCDDDAIAPNLLSRVDAVIRGTGTPVVALSNGQYWHSTWHEQDNHNLLQARPFSGRAIECDSRAVLKEMFGRMLFCQTPRSNNSFCRRDVIDEIRGRAGRFFLKPAPDYSSCAMVLATVSRYLLLDEPVFLAGTASESIGASQEKTRSLAAQEFKKEFRAELFQLSPVSIYCVINIFVESILQAKAALPDRLRGLEVNPAAFYLVCREDLLKLRKHGVDVEAELAQLESYRRGQGLRMRALLWRFRARAAIGRSPLGGPLRRIKAMLGAGPAIPTGPLLPPVIIRGEEAGFTNILECVRLLPQLAPRLCAAAS